MLNNKKIIYKLRPNFRLIKYGLDDANDDVANYLILSLQTDQIVPATEEIICTCNSFNPGV